MTESEEKAWTLGRRAAWRSLLGQCLKELGYGADDLAAAQARWAAEREDAIAMLRQVCEDHGDNDWPDDLHLGDVIEKHLWNHLEADG